jgi:hypothetical protein
VLVSGLTLKSLLKTKRFTNVQIYELLKPTIGSGFAITYTFEGKRISGGYDANSRVKHMSKYLHDREFFWCGVMGGVKSINRRVTTRYNTV